MTFHCNGCENERDFHKDYGILVIDGKNDLKRFCRICYRPKVSVPDVYWDGKPEENLADDPRTGKPRIFSSPGEKAAYLKERNLREAGDRVHGAPVTFSQNQNRKADTRPQVQEALRRVSEMSGDYRKQEYLRIIKEGRHA